MSIQSLAIIRDNKGGPLRVVRSTYRNAVIEMESSSMVTIKGTVRSGLILFVVLSFTLLPLVAAPIEITQKSVPLVIKQPGSYILATNLKVMSSTGTAISIDADNVTVDLNGFAISGPGKDVGESYGVTTGRNNVTVRNGSVRDFSGGGVHLNGSNNRVENVKIQNTTHAIFVGQSSVVTRCQIYNSLSAINCDGGTVISDNVINIAQGFGIMTYGGPQPYDPTSTDFPAGGVTVIGNNLRSCAAAAIHVVGYGNRIENNTVTIPTPGSPAAIGIDLTESIGGYVVRNLIQGADPAVVDPGGNVTPDNTIIPPITP
jgi:hypothetical protein